MIPGARFDTVAADLDVPIDAAGRSACADIV
jgi:hypothetical protein